MQSTMLTQRRSQYQIDLRWTILISVLIHLLVLMKVEIEKSNPTLPPEIAVILQRVIEPIVQEPIPEPPPPKPVIKKLAPPKVKPAVPSPEPTPTAPVVEELPETLPEVIEEAAPVEPVAQQVTPRQMENILNNYSSILAGHLSQFKGYPRIAQMRGWQGEVTIELELSKAGEVLSSRVFRSSGYISLDNEAMAMIKRAVPLPKPTGDSALENRIKVYVPIKFSLQ
jgi:periplasmic protein TonB